MQIILVDRSEAMLQAWEYYFSGQKDVTISLGDITTIDCDAVVSPANSFGFMDGGLDRALSEHFGWDLQERLQKQIKESPEGELLIGQSILLETFNKQTPYLISAPTMRVPMDFNINTSINAYLAMKAVLIRAKNTKAISSVAVPGLCTGSGKMDKKIAARQMFQAYKEIVLGEKMNFTSFGEAQKYHWNINPEGKIWRD